jgi:hypothetical protein
VGTRRRRIYEVDGRLSRGGMEVKDAGCVSDLDCSFQKNTVRPIRSIFEPLPISMLTICSKPMCCLKQVENRYICSRDSNAMLQNLIIYIIHHFQSRRPAFSSLDVVILAAYLHLIEPHPGLALGLAWLEPQ